MPLEGSRYRQRLADLRRLAERFPGTPAGVQARKELEQHEARETAITAIALEPIHV